MVVTLIKKIMTCYPTPYKKKETSYSKKDNPYQLMLSPYSHKEFCDGNALLLESGGYVLLENGGKILL